MPIFPRTEKVMHCTLCSVTKPTDQSERMRKQNEMVCKEHANNILKYRREKYKNDGISIYECACGS